MSPTNASAVSLWGEYYEVDSLSACVRAAMATWGTDLPYYYVAGLSGAAFAPSVCAAGDCVACPVSPRSPSRIRFLGHALGFSVALSAARRDGWEDFRRRSGNAVNNGAVLLCGSWPCWSIARNWQEDLSELTLTAPLGLEPTCTVDEATRLCILRRTTPCLTTREAFKEAVRFGAAMTAGRTGRAEQITGLQFYDAWLSQMEEPAFCPHGHPEGWRCAERVASGVVATSLAAVRFLNRIYSLPMDLSDREDLDAAARSFARLAAKLSPFTTGSGLDQIWQRPSKRECYMRTLRCARSTHASAATHLSGVAALL